jgi:hypothetical protein
VAARAHNPGSAVQFLLIAIESEERTGQILRTATFVTSAAAA